MIAIAVDWSGAKKPAGKICLAEASQGLLTRLEPMHSREEVVQEVTVTEKILAVSVGRLCYAQLIAGVCISLSRLGKGTIL